MRLQLGGDFGQHWADALGGGLVEIGAGDEAEPARPWWRQVGEQAGRQLVHRIGGGAVIDVVMQAATGRAGIAEPGALRQGQVIAFLPVALPMLAAGQGSVELCLECLGPARGLIRVVGHAGVGTVYEVLHGHHSPSRVRRVGTRSLSASTPVDPVRMVPNRLRRRSSSPATCALSGSLAVSSLLLLLPVLGAGADG